MTVMKVVAHSRHARDKIKARKRNVFNVREFLDSAGLARRIVEYSAKQRIYSQGDPPTSVLYIQRGSVKLSVVNRAGKEGVVAMLGPGDFFGEGGMAGQFVRTMMATAMTPTTILVIGKSEMIRVLHAEHE